MASANKDFSAEQEAALREALKRCSEATVNAAVAYRKDGDNSGVSTVVIGIIERFVEPDVRPKLAQPEIDNLRVAEDLGIDSLTLVEVVMLVEETLDMQIDNNELQNLATIGSIKSFVSQKIGAGAA